MRKKDWKPSETLIDFLKEANDIAFPKRQQNKSDKKVYNAFQDLIKEIEQGTKKGRKTYDLILAYLCSELNDDEELYKNHGEKFRDYLH